MDRFNESPFDDGSDGRGSPADPASGPASGPAFGRLAGQAASVLGGVLGGEGFDARLARWAADAAVDETARARLRARWLRVQAEEEATFLGTMIDLAEQGRPVGLEAAGASLRGAIVGAGSDFVAVRTGRTRVLVALDVIEMVRADPAARAVTGDRDVLVDRTLAAVLASLAEERPRAVLRTRAGSAVAGELRSVGADVATIRAEADPPQRVAVRIPALATVEIDF